MPKGVSDAERRSRRGRVPLLWLAAARAVLGIVVFVALLIAFGRWLSRET